MSNLFYAIKIAPETRVLVTRLNRGANPREIKDGNYFISPAEENIDCFYDDILLPEEFFRWVPDADKEIIFQIINLEKMRIIDNDILPEWDGEGMSIFPKAREQSRKNLCRCEHPHDVCVERCHSSERG